MLAYLRDGFRVGTKEMGASGAHYLQASLSQHDQPRHRGVDADHPRHHLGEAFLSFLGIGIQEPLTSWGLLMRHAQNLQSLGQYPWMLSPVIFIIGA